MANNERLIWKGQRADAVSKLSEIENKAEQMLIYLREQLNPTLELDEFNTENILALAGQFRDLQLQARKQQEQINKLNELLGYDEFL